MVHNNIKPQLLPNASLTTRRQVNADAWVDKVIVRGASGDLELTPRSWWQRIIPGSNPDHCRRVVDKYIRTDGHKLNATSLAHLSANVMNLNAVLRAPAAGSAVTQIAHPVGLAGVSRHVQVEALARELLVLTMDRDLLPPLRFAIDLHGVHDPVIAKYIALHQALTQSETSAVLLVYGEVMRAVDVARRLLAGAPYHRDVGRSVANLQRALNQQVKQLEHAAATLQSRLEELLEFAPVLTEMDRGNALPGGFTLPRCEHACTTVPEGAELTTLMAWHQRAMASVDYTHRFLTGYIASVPANTPRRIPHDPLPQHYPFGAQQCLVECLEVTKAYIQSGRRS